MTDLSEDEYRILRDALINAIQIYQNSQKICEKNGGRFERDAMAMKKHSDDATALLQKIEGMGANNTPPMARVVTISALEAEKLFPSDNQSAALIDPD